MKRREIEERVSQISGDFSARVEGNPIPAFFVGILVGVFLTITRSFVLPILIVGSVLAWVLWLLGDLDQEGDSLTPESDSDAAVKQQLPEQVADSNLREEESPASQSPAAETEATPSDSDNLSEEGEEPAPAKAEPTPKAAEPLETYTPIKPSSDGKSKKASKPATKRAKKKPSASSTAKPAEESSSKASSKVASKVNGAAVNGTGKSTGGKGGKSSSKSKSSKSKRKTGSSSKKSSRKPEA